MFKQRVRSFSFSSCRIPLSGRSSRQFVRLALVLALASLGPLSAVCSAGQQIPSKPADLFKVTNVWTVHLTFTPENWEAMEPKGGGGFFGGGRGPGRPGGPGGFGPAMFLAPVFLKQADLNDDGKVARDEFAALAEKWFAAWDTNKSDRINADQVRSGLNASLAGPESGPSGGPPGGRGPGLNLLGAEGKRNGLASAAGVEFKYVGANLEFEGRALNDIAVRYKGNGTWMGSQASLKRSLKLDLNDLVKGQKLAGVTTLNLHNSVTDASWMNEVLSYRLYRDAKVPAPRTAYAKVFVTVPGKHDRKFLGLYSLVEDVGKPFAEDNFGSKKGAIFKPVTPNLFADLGDDWKKYNQTYDPKTDLTPEQKQRVMDFSRLVTRADDTEFEAKLEGFLDLDQFARYMAVTVWLSTMDSILAVGQNYYLHLNPKSFKFEFIPWDLDHSFGQFPMVGSQDQRENLSIQKPWRGDNRFLERVYQVPAFQKLYRARMEEFSRTIFRPERLQGQVDEVALAIRPAVGEESENRLARFDKVVSGESVRPEGFGGFGQQVKPIKGFVTPRSQSIADQLSGKAEGQTIGEFGFGGPGGPGGRGGPGAFGPGMFLGGAFMSALDSNKDGTISRKEFTEGFGVWFVKWNSDQSGFLTDEQLRAGINQDLAPFRGGPPGFGSGPPPGE